MAIALPAYAKKAPSATATFSAESVAVGVGYTWGHGVLTYKGQTYPFTVKGLSAVGAGAEEMAGTADIYNLKAKEDFAGIYSEAGVGGSVGTAGHGTAILKNHKGVEVRLHAKNKGLAIHLAVSGVAVSFPEN